MTDATANALPAERLAGFPCWIELYTPGIDASAAFYRDLLGWEITRAEPGEPLTTEVHQDGRLIGSFEPAEEVHGDPGWRVSFMVDDVRTAAGAAERTGGSVVVEPTHVTETMAYALASDPDGNIVGLLEDADCEGPYPYQAGMPVWFDVLSSDLALAERFYREAAGWSTRRLTIADQEQLFLHGRRRRQVRQRRRTGRLLRGRGGSLTLAHLLRGRGRRRRHPAGARARRERRR